jgi:23S rRNA 5-hydroxycytidine C2501 synthase
MQIELELLAPAKNKEIGIAAIDCGADAVYIAAEKFGAREAASNNLSDIKELVNYAHQYNAKIYVALNTILYENELTEVHNLIKEIYETGADALIVQDMGITAFENLPPIPLHASTQCNIRDTEQAVFLTSIGFTRLILARELSIDQIKAIHDKTSATLEFFVHGALCVSYSGQCYLSQYLTGRSANRGGCAQACRSNYNLEDSAGNILITNTPLLSLKDYNLSENIGDLAKAGITSFKIEGRLKNSSYVKNIVKYYRQKIDIFISNNPQYTRASLGKIYGGFSPDPYKTFNRGFTQLFINGKRGEWKSEYGAKYMGEFIGTVTKAYCDRGTGTTFEYTPTLDSSSPISNGDGLCFLLKNGSVSGARANVCHGNTITANERIKLSKGTKIFRNYNLRFEKELCSNTPKRLIPIDLHFEQYGKGQYLIRGNWNLQEIEYRVTEEITPAKNEETARQNILSQLGKSAGLFNFTVKEIRCSQMPFFTTSTLNRLRREIAELAAIRVKEAVQERKITDSIRQKEASDKALAQRGKVKTYIMGKEISYLGNIANSLAKRVYLTNGAKSVSEAYEICTNGEAELMRTKYCIKYELGLCTGKNKGKSKVQITSPNPVNYPLYLINGKNRLRLSFDCERCEMIIIG